MEARIASLEKDVQKFQSQIEDLTSMTANMRGDLTDALNKIDKEKEVFTDAVGIKLVEGENKINLVV